MSVGAAMGGGGHSFQNSTSSSAKSTMGPITVGGLNFAGKSDTAELIGVAKLAVVGGLIVLAARAIFK